MVSKKYFSPKTILITGAAGFVGSALARNLAGYCPNIHVLVRKTSNLWRLKDIRNKLQIHYADLLEIRRLRQIINEIQPQIIFHLATFGGYPTRQTAAATIYKTNLLGTINLVQACQKINYEAFISTGSSSEYGIKNHPMSEDDSTDPYLDYGVAKLAATHFCRLYARKFQRPLLTLRLFSVYGPFEESFRLIPSIILPILKKQPINLSSPDPVRDYVYIEDVVEAYLKAAKQASKFSGEIFNVGSGVQTSIKEVVKKMGEILPKMPEAQWGKLKNLRTEPKNWRADTKKSHTLINWNAKHALKQGLQKTYNWFKTNSHLYQ